ncbi:MAG TPA: hypothetical protein VMD53_06910 [Rhizomicrobium sp.]|nr:hypothetical protein [Rhizomicrobium sp.]
MIGAKTLLLGALLALSGVGLGIAATTGKAPEPYAPGLGDFMTAYIQPHHTKLWLAGASGNWELAAYEANELDETFSDVKTYKPSWKNVPVAKLVGAILKPSLRQVDAAIAAKNVTAFKSAYGGLTTACNACHRAAGRSFINIVVPATNPYADQNLIGH